MTEDPGIFIGKGTKPVYLQPGLANRHGLIAGATGTGKTVSLQILAEDFSRRGVPVFMADVKGDLSGISQPGKAHPKLAERAEIIGLPDYWFEAFPVVFWDMFGKKGHRIRATVSDMGPLLLARMLGLNETQEGVLYAVFKLADDQGMLLLDLKDLRALLTFAGENAKQLTLEYGNIPRASVGAIQRRLLVLEQEGAKHFLGEPALDLHDFMRIGAGGYGQPILTGIRLDDMGLILEGAIPAAALALLVQGLFEVIERALLLRGLRIAAHQGKASP